MSKRRKKRDFRRRDHGHFRVGGDGFDEIVVGEWLHLERMDRRVWWMRLGQREADIIIGSDGQPEVRWHD